MNSEERLRAFGSRVPLSPGKKLQAGELAVIYENGSVRQIVLGNTEVVRMIYSAVRDRNWKTIAPVIQNEELAIQNDSFEIKLHASYREQEIHFEADYRISGSPNRLRFEMDGVAVSGFLKNRIGFCVLHPIRECAGKSGRAIHPDGKSSEFHFPRLVAPDQPVQNLKSMFWEPEPGVEACLDFSGDVFEMEDQRNWTDASFKTYCTPLELPFPAKIDAGERVIQTVELSVSSKKKETCSDEEVSFAWDESTVVAVPNLGLSVSSRPEPLTASEIGLLARLPVSHYRVELKMQKTDAAVMFSKAVLEADQLGCPLFVVLYLSGYWLDEYHRFVSFCSDAKAEISHLLIVGANHLPFPEFDAVAAMVRSHFPEIKVGTGVNAHFAELNRTRPSASAADFVNFTICPQVHAFDHWSLVENIEAQSEVMKSARRLFPDKPVTVSPVSLRQRFNVVATATEPDPAPGTLPASVDVRQRSVFAASWMLGSLKALAMEGCSLITYFESVGWKGVMQGENPSPAPELFPVDENEVFPVCEVLEALADCHSMLFPRSSQPLLADGLVLNSGRGDKLFIWSFSLEPVAITWKQPIRVLSGRSLLYAELPEVAEHGFLLRPMDLLVFTIVPAALF